MSPEIASSRHVPTMNTQFLSESYNLTPVSNDQKHLERHNRQQQHHQHHSQRLVHFDEHKSEAEEGQHEHAELEVSCEHNPTQLFLLMNRQLWDSALSLLHRAPIEAHTWISSLFPNSDEYRWRNLPLHLACLHGPEPVPLHFMEVLIGTYPEAAQCRNYEGNLPIHLACECVDLSPRFGLEVEGILITLIKAFPECLGMKDSTGRRPIDILEEKGMRALNRENVVGRGVGIIKYMKTHARSIAAVEQHLGRDEYAKKGDHKSRRRPRSIEVPNAERSRNVEVPQTERLSHFKSTSPPRYNGEEDPPSFQQSFPFSPSNKSWQGAAATDPSDSNTQDNRIFIEPREQGPHIVSPTTPFNPMPMATPRNTKVLPLTTNHFDPFYHLETEMNSMRNAHQSMTVLLNTKAQSESELQGRIRNSEEELSQLKKKFDNLTNKHSGTVAELEEQTRAHDKCSYELKIIKSKEKAVSSELALKLEIEGQLLASKTELEKERGAKNTTLEKLEHQLKVCSDLEETMEVSNSEASKLARENEQLSTENKHLHGRLDIQEKQLQEAKVKEATLLGLLSKMHSMDDLEEITEENKALQLQIAEKSQQLQESRIDEVTAKSENQKLAKDNKGLQQRLAQQKIQLQETKSEELKSKNENATLSKEKKDLKQQIAQQKNQLQDTKAKESKLKTLLGKVKESIEKTKFENDELKRQIAQKSEQLHETTSKESKSRGENGKLATENRELQTLLVQQNEQLHEIKAKESKLLFKLLENKNSMGEKKSETVSEAKELSAKNVMLRDVALKAIETVGALQQKLQRPLSGDRTKDRLTQLLKDSEMAPTAASCYSRKSHTQHDANNSFELLDPIINDAQSILKDTVGRIQQLLQQSHGTIKLIEHIPSIPQENIAFESTLKILEHTMTSHVHILEALDGIAKKKEKCNSEVISLFNREPLGVIDNLLAQTKNNHGNNEALCLAALSSIRQNSTKMVLITRKHVETLESLSQTVARLPQVKRINLDSDRKYIQEHLKVVDEITTVLQRALIKLVEDAKQMKSVNQKIHIAFE